jgi:hypothetical protein
MAPGLAPVNRENQGHYPLTGSCLGIEGFQILSPTFQEISCLDGKWNAVIDLTEMPDGFTKIETNLHDEKGNPIVFDLIKDTQPPMLSDLILDFGKHFTNKKVLPFSVSQSEGYWIYLTDVAGCSSGGTWQLLATTTFVNIDSPEGVKTIYAKIKDLAGNESACVSDSITLDLTAPVLTGLLDDSHPEKSYFWNWGCTDISACSYRFIVDQMATTEPVGAFGSLTSASQISGDGFYYLHIQAQDESGNLGSVSHVRALLDNTGPNLAISSPTPILGNSSTIFQWDITYSSDTNTVTLSAADITLGGTHGHRPIDPASLRPTQHRTARPAAVGVGRRLELQGSRRHPRGAHRHRDVAPVPRTPSLASTQ